MTTVLGASDQEIRRALIADLGWLARHPQTFPFVTVGGSVGRMKAMSDNDVDLFVHCADSNLAACRGILEAEIPKAFPDVRFAASPYLVHGFGIRYGIIRTQGPNYDLFIVSPSLTFGFETFDHHLLLFGGEDEFRSALASYHVRTIAGEGRTAPPVESTFFTIASYANRLTRSFRKGQTFEAERSAQQLRAILYGLRKWAEAHEPYDWFTCNLLIPAVPAADFAVFSGNSGRLDAAAIDRILAFMTDYMRIGFSTLHADTTRICTYLEELRSKHNRGESNDC